MNRFITHALVCALALAIFAAHSLGGVTLGTEFTYQGVLNKGGLPLNDTVDMTFRLYDLPINGVQVGGDNLFLDVPVDGGLFSVVLNFGSVFSTTAARFLEIEVDGNTLSPRQFITTSPVSIHSQNTRGISVDSQEDVSIGTTSSMYKFQVYTNDRTRAIYGNNFDNSGGNKYGVFGRATSVDGIGVYGLHDASTGTNAGVYGETDSTTTAAVGVYGVVDTTSPGIFSAAVRGENRGTSTSGIGVYGSHDGQGWGVYGTTTGGIGRGVFGHVTGTGGVAGYFQNDNGVALYVDGAENTGSTAAMIITSGSQTMYIDGNEIDSSSGALYLNNNTNNPVIVGSDMELPGANNSLDVGGYVAARFGSFGYYDTPGPVIFTYLVDDSGPGVIHIRFEATGIVGSITSLSGAVSYNAFTGSHYAVALSPIEAGTLVRMTGENRRLADTHSTEPVYGVEATIKANDPACFGAYLGLHNDLNTTDGLEVHLVAAVGNSNLFITDDGRGNIEPGDLLISSDISGCAMKDDPMRFSTGFVIARAAERLDWSTVTPDADGIKRTRISVLLDSTVRSSPASDVEIQARLEDQQQQIDQLQQQLNQLLNTQEFNQ